MTVKEVTFVCRSREIFDNDNIYLKIIMDAAAVMGTWMQH